MTRDQFKALQLGDNCRVTEGFRAGDVGRVTVIVKPYKLKLWFGVGDSYEFYYNDVERTGQTKFEI